MQKVCKWENIYL